MKNFIKEICIFTILVICLLFILQNPLYLKEQTIYAMELWLTKVVPILFPTFILNDFLFQSSFLYKIQKKAKINLFYIISMISGCPANAYIVKEEKRNMTKLLAVNKYPSFVFTFSFLTLIFSKKEALLLIVFNILCNSILVFFIKPPHLQIEIPKVSFFEQLITSIKKAGQTLITIAGTILFFNLLPISYMNNPYIKTILLSLLEITSSFQNLSTVTLPYSFKLFATILTLSTCGLCIDAQIKSIVNDTIFKYKDFIKYRLLHLILFLLLGLLLLKF